MKFFFGLLIVCSSYLTSNNFMGSKEANQVESSLSGTWKGTYEWSCLKGGSEEVTMEIIDTNGVLTGTIFYKGESSEISGKRLEGATLGEWRYSGGIISEKGRNVFFTISKNLSITQNYFSGELNKNSIIGIAQNGEGCSSFKGPSGHFSVKRVN